MQDPAALIPDLASLAAELGLEPLRINEAVLRRFRYAVLGLAALRDPLGFLVKQKGRHLPVHDLSEEIDALARDETDPAAMVEVLTAGLGELTGAIFVGSTSAKSFHDPLPVSRWSRIVSRAAEIVLERYYRIGYDQRDSDFFLPGFRPSSLSPQHWELFVQAVLLEGWLRQNQQDTTGRLPRARGMAVGFLAELERAYPSFDWLAHINTTAVGFNRRRPRT